MSKPVRVRFAPSPTGLHHLGNLRTTLFNYLFARHERGVFVLRIEDTDQERLVPEARAYIRDSLGWLGLQPDEGVDNGGPFAPYIQSQRLAIYQQYADQLVASGHAYPCWCGETRLEEMRHQAQIEHRAFKYDRHCVHQPGDPDQPHVIRFRVPDTDREVAWDDVVKGRVSFRSSDQDDFVMLKSDGFPTYNFANVIDDHLMEISHVIRGDEFVSSTPKFLLVYEAYGWQPPVFAHAPRVLGPDKTKLSKRHGAKPTLEYRDQGYLPEAVVNYLALLGWNEGEGSTQEIYSLEELIAKFSLERVQSSPAVFDEERLNWFNGMWIRKLWEEHPEELIKRAEPFWPAAAQTVPGELKRGVMALIQERLKYLAELSELTEFFFTDPTVNPKLYPQSAQAKRFIATTLEFIQGKNMDLSDITGTEEIFRTELMAKLDQDQAGPLFMTLRVALTGRTATPGLFETMAVLGSGTVLRRLKAAKTALQV